MTGTAPEVRLALVLNGGVSLAVWMGGVTHEIDLLRRASRVAGGASEESVGGVAEHDRAIFDRWVEFCQEHPFGDVVVDVIAGTSAGGLNGTLLATAVARGVPLDPPSATSGPWLREVWLREATLEEGKLLRRPDEPALPSVLDGTFFRATIDTALGQLCPADGSSLGPEPVTLFVTATALGRSDRAFRDSFGQPFDVADHRRLYRFVRGGHGSSAYDPAGTDPDRPDESWWRESVPDVFATDADPAALANAARASASFPFAFEPVPESAGLAARRVLPPAAVEPTGGRWLVDGGLLDNAPMQPVLDAITRRPLTGPMRRLLVYVVPSSGTAGAARAPAARPAVLGADRLLGRHLPRRGRPARRHRAGRAAGHRRRGVDRGAGGPLPGHRHGRRPGDADGGGRPAAAIPRGQAGRRPARRPRQPGRRPADRGHHAGAAVGRAPTR